MGSKGFPHWDTKGNDVSPGTLGGCSRKGTENGRVVPGKALPREIETVRDVISSGTRT